MIEGPPQRVLQPARQPQLAPQPQRDRQPAHQPQRDRQPAHQPQHVRQEEPLHRHVPQVLTILLSKYHLQQGHLAQEAVQATAVAALIAAAGFPDLEAVTVAVAAEDDKSNGPGSTRTRFIKGTTE